MGKRVLISDDIWQSAQPERAVPAEVGAAPPIRHGAASTGVSRRLLRRKAVRSGMAYWKCCGRRL